MNPRSVRKAWISGTFWFTAMLSLVFAFANLDDRYTVPALSLCFVSIIIASILTWNTSMTNATYEDATNLCSRLPYDNLRLDLKRKVDTIFNETTAVDVDDVYETEMKELAPEELTNAKVEIV